MRLVDGEPDFTPWETLRVRELADALLVAARKDRPGPVLVAVDGRGASGKSTLSGQLSAQVPGAVVVHTDDIAWHEPLFAWFGLLGDGVLSPLRAGQPVDFQPPAWPAHGREGRITVPADTPLVLVEGTGAAQEHLTGLYDAIIWVQADFDEAERRGIARDTVQGVNGDAAETVEFWHHWMRAELAHFAADRPWERADLVVCGTPSGPLSPGTVAVHQHR
ncbi:hypothetical protein AAEX63_13290 [Luteococcus sp. H138]|uniref:uridine kinase family protein n=1 Tax=unclassified Luteococcus TaxID=2639923 RepID=UPI00313EC493